MDEHSRPESAADERGAAASEPVQASLPSDPAHTAPIPQPAVPDSAEQPGTTPDVVSDAVPDARFHPWQVTAPPDHAFAAPVPSSWIADPAAAHYEGASQYAPPSEDPAEHIAFLAAQDTGVPLAPPDEWPAVAATPHLAAPDVEPHAEPISVAVGAPPLFTAATVPPEPFNHRPAHVPPPIPVDPSAETVPLNSRTDEVLLAGRPYPGYPGFPGSPQEEGRSSLRTALQQPLSRDAVVRFLSAACGTIVLAAVLGLLLTQGEWATGLAAAGIAALLVGGAYLVGTAVRFAAGAHKGGMLRLGLLAAIIFGLLGEAGLAFNGMLHPAEAGVLAAIGDYAGAVREYRLAGYQPPSSDLARAYIGRGNDLLHRGDYAGAASSFQVVVEGYASTSAAREAATGLLAAYDGWMSGSSIGTSLPYATILRDLGLVSKASYCDTGCAGQAGRLAARAHLQYGQQLNDRGQYAQAITQFEDVTALYPSSAYAAAAHEDAAVTYYTYGQSQRYGQTCTEAVPTFQRLASAYGDTAEGAAAKSALAAPVQVSGSLTGFPKNPMPTVYLSKTIRSNTFFSDDYSAHLDGKGAFTFKNVASGSYNLSAAIPNGSGVYWVDPATHNPYSITVGPLCNVSLQSYPYA